MGTSETFHFTLLPVAGPSLYLSPVEDRTRLGVLGRTYEIGKRDTRPSRGPGPQVHPPPSRGSLSGRRDRTENTPTLSPTNNVCLRFSVLFGSSVSRRFSVLLGGQWSVGPFGEMYNERKVRLKIQLCPFCLRLSTSRLTPDGEGGRDADGPRGEMG